MSEKSRVCPLTGREYQIFRCYRCNQNTCSAWGIKDDEVFRDILRQLKQLSSKTNGVDCVTIADVELVLSRFKAGAQRR